jgi:hypothetical protein
MPDNTEPSAILFSFANPTSVTEGKNILSVMASLPPPSVTVLRATVKMVGKSAALKPAEKPLRNPTCVSYAFAPFNNKSALGGSSALCCALYHCPAAASEFSHCRIFECK